MRTPGLSGEIIGLQMHRAPARHQQPAPLRHLRHGERRRRGRLIKEAIRRVRGTSASPAGYYALILGFGPAVEQRQHQAEERWRRVQHPVPARRRRGRGSDDTEHQDKGPERGQPPPPPCPKEHLLAPRLPPALRALHPRHPAHVVPAPRAPPPPAGAVAEHRPRAEQQPGHRHHPARGPECPVPACHRARPPSVPRRHLLYAVPTARRHPRFRFPPIAGDVRAALQADVHRPRRTARATDSGQAQDRLLGPRPNLSPRRDLSRSRTPAAPSQAGARVVRP